MIAVSGIIQNPVEVMGFFDLNHTICLIVYQELEDERHYMQRNYGGTAVGRSFTIHQFTRTRAALSVGLKLYQAVVVDVDLVSFN